MRRINWILQNDAAVFDWLIRSFPEKNRIRKVVLLPRMNSYAHVWCSKRWFTRKKTNLGSLANGETQCLVALIVGHDRVAAPDVGFMVRLPFSHGLPLIDADVEFLLPIDADAQRVARLATLGVDLLPVGMKGPRVNLHTVEVMVWAAVVIPEQKWEKIWVKRNTVFN